ncbi:MAG: hypothetical protein IKT98_07150 [Selenomonadaceae bacterium]|nr:hypothetical protein [Selenomonadaceae bacterium]
MELATIFLIWLAFTIIDNLAKRKKSRIPPPQENSPDFDIPTLANDPNFPDEEVPIFIENPNQAEIRPIKKSSAQIRQKISEPETQTEDTNELDLNLTPSNVMNAFILSEILGKPKALR